MPAAVVGMRASVMGQGDSAAADVHGDRKRRRRGSGGEGDEELKDYWNALRKKSWRNPDQLGHDPPPAAAQIQAGLHAAQQPAPTSIPKVEAKVDAKWMPDQGRNLSLPEALVFFPDAEEFEDPVKYIESVRALAEPKGICRIVPPYSWRPQCVIDDKNLEINTRFQQVHKLQRRTAATSSTTSSAAGGSEAPKTTFGFIPGPMMTLADFKTYADGFKYDYFGSNRPELGDVEREYWRIVEESKESVEVLYGADLDTRTVGSGFPKPGPGRNDVYERSGWNLNNTAKLMGSMLSCETSNISGVIVPRLYVGMCFSSFCWQTEEHHFYSINYLHSGDQKIWYGVPRNSASKLENTMKKYMPDLFKHQPHLLQKLVTQFSPALLQEEKLEVYKAVQRQGDFIVTFPRAYHCGFSTGFSCAEAVNFAPLDWFSHGQSAVELYQKFRRKPLVSHDKLLLTAVNHCLGAKEYPERAHPFWRQASSDANKLTILLKAFKCCLTQARVQTEHSRLVWLGDALKEQKMGAKFDEDEERECFYCHYDLHLSAISCPCCPGRYSCLEHVDMLCKCSKEQKNLITRHTIQELYQFQLALEKLRRDSTEQRTDSSGASASTMSQTKRKVRGATPSVGSAFIQAPAVVLPLYSLSKSDQVVVLSDDDEETPEQKPEPKLETEPELKVELLEAGTLPQAGWCSKDSIFPAGYKSRVRYINFLDVSQTAYYVSEIVDCGLEEPYFKVTLEGHPTHCFVDLSIDSCWRSVQRRLNFEIQSKRKLGIYNLPPVRPLGKVNGLEMFGLSNPKIKQVVEALDYKYACSKYWSWKKAGKAPESSTDVLKRLFRKGDRDELWMMHQVFSSDWGCQTWKQGFQALTDVLQNVLESAIEL